MGGFNQCVSPNSLNVTKENEERMKGREGRTEGEKEERESKKF